MRLIRTGVLATAAIVCLASTPAWAQLEGTSVNGVLNITGFAQNFFDPAIGFVPAGFLNSAGPTVTISLSANEFGYDDSANEFGANFLGATLDIGNLVLPNHGSFPNNAFTMRFTDAAFAGMSVVEVGDTFYAGGVNASLSGTVLTLTSPGGNVGTPGTSYTASYRFVQGSVPDGGATLGLLSVAFVALASLKRSRYFAA